MSSIRVMYSRAMKIKDDMIRKLHKSGGWIMNERIVAKKKNILVYDTYYPSKLITSHLVEKKIIKEKRKIDAFAHNNLNVGPTEYNPKPPSCKF